MKAIEKYYILKRNDSKILTDYLTEFSSHECSKFKLDENKPLLLIEKTIYEDHTEGFTFLWTIENNITNLWTTYTKKNVVYDYTGIVYPLIHVNENIYFYDDYMSKKNLYVVTAYNRVKSYRVVISKQITYDDAATLKKNIEHCNSIANQEYIYFTELQIEKAIN